MIYSNNKNWLIVIAVILVGIFLVMFHGGTQDNQANESISNMIDDIGDESREFQEEVKDEIDENSMDGR